MKIENGGKMVKLMSKLTASNNQKTTVRYCHIDNDSRKVISIRKLRFSQNVENKLGQK